jgi:hypothetical protein
MAFKYLYGIGLIDADDFDEGVAQFADPVGLGHGTFEPVPLIFHYHRVI